MSLCSSCLRSSFVRPLSRHSLAQGAQPDLLNNSLSLALLHCPLWLARRRQTRPTRSIQSGGDAETVVQAWDGGGGYIGGRGMRWVAGYRECATRDCSPLRSRDANVGISQYCGASPTEDRAAACLCSSTALERLDVCTTALSASSPSASSSLQSRFLLLDSLQRPIC